MLRVRNLLLIVLLAIGIAACGGTGTDGLTSTDKTEIRALLDRFASGVKQMDINAMGEVFASQVTIIEPGQPPITGNRDDYLQQMQDAFVFYNAVHDAYFTVRSITGSTTNAVADTIWFIDSTVFGQRAAGSQDQEWRFRKNNGTWQAYQVETK